MSAIEQVSEAKTNLTPPSEALVKSESKEPPHVDGLSHELRTALHSISSHIEFLQRIPQLLQRTHFKLNSMPPQDLKKSLRKIAALFKNNLKFVQTNLRTLDVFITTGQYEALSRELKKTDELKISPVSEFTAKQRDMERSYIALAKTQKTLYTLATQEEKLNGKALANPLKDTVATLKSEIAQAKTAAETLQTLIPTGWGQAIKEPSYSETFSSQLLTALVVDDIAINRKILGKHLQKEGFQCDFAENGAQAVEKFFPEKYDVIFMDITMPVMDGYQATQAIRKREMTEECHPTPILAVTAIAPTAENADKVKAVGMNDFISKPFSATQLKSLIQRYSLKQPESPLSSDSEEAPASPSPAGTQDAYSPAKLMRALGFMASTPLSAPTLPSSEISEPSSSIPISTQTPAHLIGAIGFMAHRASLGSTPMPPPLSVIPQFVS